MQSAKIYPRHLGNNLKPHSEVTLVGMPKNINDKDLYFTLQIDPECDLSVKVYANDLDEIQELKSIVYLQVRGECLSSKEVKMSAYTNFHEDFDLPSYNKMLQFANKEFKNLFYP